MPGRDPEARERTLLVAEKIQAAMRAKGLTNRALRSKLVEAGFEVNNDQWVTRRLNGDTDLTEPVKVVYGPTAELKAMAKILGLNADTLVRVVNKPKTDNPSAAADN